MFKWQKTIFSTFLILIIAFSGLTYIHELVKMSFSSDFGDFGNYYFYSKALSLNYNIYKLDAVATQTLAQSFGMPEFVRGTGHSPIFLSLIKGITYLPFRLASILWLFLNNILLISSILIILKLAFEKIPNLDKEFLNLSSIFFVLSYQPLLESMALGQSTVLILFFLILSLNFLNHKKYGLSGLVLSLSILIKPHLGIFLIFFLWKKCYRVFFSSLISLLVLEVLSLILNGPSIEYYYWTSAIFKFFSRNLTNMSMANLSFLGLINRIVNVSLYGQYLDIIIGLVSIFSLTLFGYTLYLIRGRFKDLDEKFILDFSLVIICLFMVFPLVHEHHFVLLYLPIIFSWAKLNKELRRVPLILFMISYLLIGLRYNLIRFPEFGSGFFSIFSGFKLYGVAVLFLLIVYLKKAFKTTDV